MGQKIAGNLRRALEMLEANEIDAPPLRIDPQSLIGLTTQNRSDLLEETERQNAQTEQSRIDKRNFTAELAEAQKDRAQEIKVQENAAKLGEKQKELDNQASLDKLKLQDKLRGDDIVDSFVGEDGNVYTIDKEGVTSNTGVKAEPNIKLTPERQSALGALKVTNRKIADMQGALAVVRKGGQLQAGPYIGLTENELMSLLVSEMNERDRLGSIAAGGAPQSGGDSDFFSLDADGNLTIGGAGSVTPSSEPLLDPTPEPGGESNVEPSVPVDPNAVGILGQLDVPELAGAVASIPGTVFRQMQDLIGGTNNRDTSKSPKLPKEKAVFIRRAKAQLDEVAREIFPEAFFTSESKETRKERAEARNEFQSKAKQLIKDSRGDIGVLEALLLNATEESTGLVFDAFQKLLENLPESE